MGNYHDRPRAVMEDLVTARTLAVTLGIDRGWLIREAEAGRIPSLVAPSHLSGTERRRFNPDAVKHALAQRAAFEGQTLERAEKMLRERGSTIAGGKPGEDPLRSWAHGGVYVVERPPDEQGILRISIGGNDVAPNYCTFRGDREECVKLLRRALLAMEEGS